LLYTHYFTGETHYRGGARSEAVRSDDAAVPPAAWPKHSSRPLNEIMFMSTIVLMQKTVMAAYQWCEDYNNQTHEGTFTVNSTSPAIEIKVVTVYRNITNSCAFGSS
jgi:hypothetical protein